MKTILYCFSATGNSLTTANLLAKGFENCEVIPVASLMGEDTVTADADAVGYVFPVYYGDMPYPVRETVMKTTYRENAYIFTVMTYRGHAGKAAERLNLLLHTRDAKLSYADGVHMPVNSYINEPEIDAAYLAEQKNAVQALIEPIKNRTVQEFSAEELPDTPVSKPENFRGIAADERCMGCGTCAQVCPMENITVENGKAVIGENCATCLACFHWCPVEAIWMSKQENIARRKKYRHPNVSFWDIVGQKDG